MNIDKFNLNQREAILKNDGPLMLLAGAGSGKTATLVGKVSYVIDQLETSPFQILALTFSNKAAREMRERIAREIGINPEALNVTTFHAFCSRVLRKEADYLGLSRNFTIYDESESKAIAKNLITKRGISLKELSPYEVLYFIENLKNNGYYEGKKDLQGFEPDYEDPLYQYFTEYESELHRSNAVDFGGLITGILQLFENYPQVLASYQDRYKFVFIDEYQDTNRAQFFLMNLIAKKSKHICVVGDEDQSIYSWRGADIRNILDFEKYYPEASLIKLEQNYRSSKTIIEAATCVISRNEMRKGKSMWTDNAEGEVIDIVECRSDRDESHFVSKKVLELRSKGVSINDIAVFYRNNSQSRVLEDSLRSYNVPYRILGGIKFYDRKEIKDLLAYIKMVVNPQDSLALARVINIPTRGIGAVTMRKIETEAIKYQMSLWDFVVKLVENPEISGELRLSAKVKKGIQEFVATIQEAQLKNREKDRPSLIYDKLLNESGYLLALKQKKDYESLARIDNLKELLNGVKQYEEENPEGTLSNYLESLTLDKSNDGKNEDKGKGELVLMTVHSAKGLEYPYVIIVGAEENIFPSYKSLEEREVGVEEERRLFYVAMTRAMKHLYIAFAQGRMLFGQLNFNGPSRFISEIPEKYYVWKRQYGEDEHGNSFSRPKAKPKVFKDDIDNSSEFSQEEYLWPNSNQAPVKPKRPPVLRKKTKAILNNHTYGKGSTIVHSLYGKGRVLHVEGSGPNEKVLIKFTNGVQKMFLVKYAPLTRCQ